MRTRFRLLRASALLLLIGLPVQAKLAPTTLDSLLADAELIIEATPRQLTRQALGSGEARLVVLRVHKGTFTETEITLRWGSEVHDQHLESLDHDYLLFLKREPDGRYVSAQYGRSYWPFTGTVIEPERANLEHESRGFSFDYPLTMVQLTPAQQQVLFDPARADGKRPFISMKRLRALFPPRDAGR